MKSLVLLLGLLLTSPAMSQAEFKIFGAEPLGQFMVFGRITDGFESEMRKAIAKYPKLKRIEIESLGGLTLEANRTAKLLNKHDITIRVSGRCASACVGLWAATNHRELAANARIGMHAGLPVRNAPGALEYAASYYRQKINAEMLRHAGFSDHLIAKGNEIPHSTILWLTPSELAADGVKFTLVDKPPNNSFKRTAAPKNE